MPKATRSRKNAFHILSDRWTNSVWLQDHLNAEEIELVEVTVREYRRRLQRADPAVVMRLEGIIVLYILARRTGLTALSAGLAPVAEGDRDAHKKPVDGDEVGKSQERLRKALKEFEDALGETPDAGAKGLADLLRPLLKETEGIAEEAAVSTNGQRG